MKRIIFALLLSVTSIYCSGQDYIDWVSTQSESVKYGYLYNYYAATDSRNIAASGWHVPSFSETTTIITYIADTGNEGLYLKEVGLTYWNSPNTGATNSLKFNFRGAGYRQSSGTFSDLKNVGIIGTSDIIFSTNWRARSSGYNVAYFAASYNDLKYGFSLRLVKDYTTLSHGQTGTYTGNDGKIYRTICIGTQEWLADNLAETKYRNGDAIPEVTDNTAWSALTTGARCVYNNDESNR